MIQILLNYLTGFKKVNKKNNIIQIKALVSTDSTTWSDGFVNVYLNNYLVGQESEDCIGKLDSGITAR